ncbi:MAG: hypothetical protein OIF36_00745 [Alphaproteobacteria bacterium]|nr:hypothetical protein [Alphaproteobacteria bacterium]MCV6598998.1 hypothetical protein [Alphaproteobacteria bacterium]
MNSFTKYFEVTKTPEGKYIHKKTGEEMRPSCATCRTRGKIYCPISKCNGNNCGNTPK